MVVGELAEPADVVVLGAGPGGCTAALGAAAAGADVVLVDAGGLDGVGGTCLHAGCIPGKALIELASIAGRIDASKAMGLTVASSGCDLKVFQEFKRTLVDRHRERIRQDLATAGVRVMAGRGRFTGRSRLAVVAGSGPVSYVDFGHAVIATGAVPVELEALPFAPGAVLDAADLLALDELPFALCVVGAVCMGVELGMALAQLGVRVTLVEAQDAVLPRFDPVVVEPLRDRLDQLGVEVLLGSTVAGGHAGTVAIEGPGGRRISREVDKVLVAAGRRPNVADLGLERLGVDLEPSGHIAVDSRLRATDNAFAIGDVVAGPSVAHKATMEAEVAVANIGGAGRAVDALAIPLVVFADPEIASVGLTAAEAKAAGLDAITVGSPFASSERAATLNDRAGSATVVVDQATDRIVGAQVAGPRASELIAEVTLALEMIASPGDIAGAVHAHPTLAELWSEAARAAVDEARTAR